MSAVQPEPPPPASGDEREDQAAVSGAEAAAVLAAATAAILAAMAAAIGAVVAGTLTWQMARRRIRRTVAGLLGHASAQLGPVWQQAAREARAGGERAGQPGPLQGGRQAGPPGMPPGTHSGSERGRGPSRLLPDAPEQVAKAILNAQQDAGEAFDAAMYAALGGKGGALPPGSPYREAVEKAMRRLTGIGEDVKDLTGAERAALSLSRLQAAQHVMDDLAGKGLTGFTDSAGRRWSLDAYAEMATRTAASRMHLSSQLSMMAQAGNDLVIVDNPARAAPCPLCVLPGTVVEGPAPEWRVRSEYAGDVVRIATASGKDLTGTPDHTVLTPQGWRRLKELRPGDQVISNAGQEFACPPLALDVVGVVMPDDVQMPALIEYAGESRTPLLLASPARRDFDSDIAYREIDVVWPDGPLLDEGDSALAQPSRNLDFIVGVGFSLSFLGDGAFNAPRHGNRSATGSGVSSPDHPLSLLSAGTCPAQPHGSRLLLMQDDGIHGLDCAADASPPRSCLNVGKFEVAAGRMAGNSESGTELVARLARQVASAEFGDLRFGKLARPYPVRDGRFPVRGEDGDCPRVADLEGGHELLKRLAGSVAPDEVVSVNMRHFPLGHVWDLQTGPSWYLTNGIVSHNCRPYEGKVLSLSGSASGASTIIDASGVERTEQVMTSLADAVAHGLLHPNCRHSLAPWTEGAGAVATAGGKERGYVEGGQPVSSSLPIGTPKDYENEQKLRAHERAVRRDHVRVSSALTPQAKAKARQRLGISQGALQDHVTATGVQRQPRREKPYKPRRTGPSGALPPSRGRGGPPSPPRSSPAPAPGPVIDKGPLAGFFARKLSGNKEAADYLDSVKPKLSADQAAALSYYTGDGFLQINAALREGDEGRNPEMIRLLDSSMQPTQDDLIANRRLDASAFGLTDADLGRLADLKGKTISDPAYMSTSLGSPYGGGLGGVTIYLAVPKGTPALPASPFSRNPHETELLLGRGTQVAISRAEKNPQTYAWEVWGVVVPEGAS